MHGHESAGAAISLDYESDDGLCRIPCQLFHDTLWLTAAAIAVLHRTTEQNVARQLKAAFCGRRLGAASLLKVSTPGENGMPGSKCTRYGIDAVVVVGERLGSPHGPAFAQWAREYLERRRSASSP